MEGACGLGKKCAYNHKVRHKEDNVEMKALNEDVKNLKAKMDVLKNTIKSLVSIKQEGKKLQKDLHNMKEEIKILKIGYKETEEKLKALEEELEEESDEETEELNRDDGGTYKCEYCRFHVIGKREFEKHVKKSSEFKCCKCDFQGKTDISLKKHINTKHQIEHTENANDNRMTIDESDTSEEELIFQDVDELFQLETVENELVYACNLCEEGFDSVEEVKEHLEKGHMDVLKQLGKESESEASCRWSTCQKELSKEGTTNENSERECVQTEKEGMLNCKLCGESMDGNSEVKEHYIKEHHADMKRKNSNIQCEYNHCMDIEGGKCSQFCFFYKNCITFERIDI